MASRYFNQFINGLNAGLTFMEGSFKVGSAGAVVAGSVVGNGIDASSTLIVQQKSTGTYLITLSDPFYRVLGANFEIVAGVTGSAQVDGSSSIIVGKTYQIAASSALSQATPGQLGSTGTNWYTLGLPANQTPFVGTPFVATSAASQLVGSSTQAVGTGWVQQVGVSGIDHVEVVGNQNYQIAPTSSIVMDDGPGKTQQNNGAMLWIQTIKSSSGAPVNANANTVIRWNLMLRNSSRAGFNESTTANLN